MITVLYNLLKPFKGYVLILFFLILLTAFFESFGLALLLPLVENILQEKTSSTISGIIDGIYGFLNIENKFSYTGILLIIIILLKNLLMILTKFYNTKIVFNIRKYWMLKINDNYMYCPFLGVKSQNVKIRI